MPFAESNDSRIHFSVHGGGAEVVVLIPGLGCRASEWGDRFLSSLTATMRVVCLDNRGVALSSTRVQTWTLSDMAADVCAVLDVLEVPSATIVGSSMGGLVAQTVAAESSSRAKRLALLSTGLRHGVYEMHLPRAEAITSLSPQPGLTASERQLRVLRALTAPGFADTHPDIIEQVAALRVESRIPGYVLNAHMEAMFSPNIPRHDSSAARPVMVIHGEDDPLIPIESGRLLANAILGARSAWLPACGHYPYLEKPLDCARLIETFIRETDCVTDRDPHQASATPDSAWKP
jgi:3-oxoadipate enol-lactonase